MTFKPTMTQKQADRYKLAFDLRASGLNLKQVGEKLGVSGGRVGVILQKWERMVKDPAYDHLTAKHKP